MIRRLLTLLKTYYTGLSIQHLSIHSNYRFFSLRRTFGAQHHSIPWFYSPIPPFFTVYRESSVDTFALYNIKQYFPVNPTKNYTLDLFFSSLDFVPVTFLEPLDKIDLNHYANFLTTKIDNSSKNKNPYMSMVTISKMLISVYYMF